MVWLKNLKIHIQNMTAEETKQFNEGVSGDFVGIGAEMQRK